MSVCAGHGSRNGKSRGLVVDQCAIVAVGRRAPVHAFQSAVAQLEGDFGGRVLSEPQVFPQYPQPYFATFWLDPYGLMLGAVSYESEEI